MPAYEVIPELGDVGAPVVPAAWRWKEAELTLSALLCSGAARSLLPRAAIATLGLRQIGRCRVKGITGAIEARGIHAVHLRLAGAELRYQPVVDGGALGYALIGRDILRRFVVRLDGPSWMVDIRQP